MSEPRRCYHCPKTADEPPEWSGWSHIDHSPPLCRECREHVQHLREGEERRRG